MDMKPPLPTVPKPRKRLLLKYASWFNVDGRRGDEAITEGQVVIFDAIIFAGLFKRVQLVCSTQYGKSLWVALACIVLTCIRGKSVVIVAPSKEKAKIIMRYFIEHLADHPMFYTKLAKDSRLERLRQEENKERITFNNGGTIFLISADQKNSKKSIEAAMGAGAEIVIGDEYCLIEDNTEATIFRMIAGKGKKGAYIKIGNPFYSAPPHSHFLKSWLQIGTYHRIFIDYHQALREGRYMQAFIDQARSKPLFDILYECLFPDLSIMDADGYRLLVTPEHIKFGMTPELILELMKKHEEEYKKKKGTPQEIRRIRPKLGCDIGGGGDWNVFVLRFGKFAAVVHRNRSNDTMTNVSDLVGAKAAGKAKEDESEGLMQKYGVRADDVNIDDIGIGRGVTDRLKELGYGVNAVNVGETAKIDPDSFANYKAELCWEARKWCLDPETRLDRREEWVQLTWLRYKILSDRKVQMEEKKKLKERTGASPDYAEALYLTFAQQPFIGFA